MSGYTNVGAGIFCAIAAAAFYGTGPIAQGVAARRASATKGLRGLMLRLVREPIWLAGLACELGGFVLEATAFGIAPAALIAPILAVDSLVFVMLAWAVFGGTPTRQGVGGALTLGVGVALLAVAFSSHAEIGDPADNATQFAFLGAGVFVAGFAALVGNRASAAGRAHVSAAVFGVAAGGLYGLATMGTRQVGVAFSWSHPIHLVVTPTPYLLAFCGLVAVTMLQRGLQTGPILAFPLTSAISALSPVVLGTLLLGDQAPVGGRRVAFVGALVLLVIGVVLLSRDRSIGQAHADRPAGQTEKASS
jgi:hypothetical protein